MWLVIHPNKQARLCNDFEWREITNYNKTKFDAKLYKQQGNAQKVAEKYHVNGKTAIMEVKPGDKIDMIGRVFRDFPASSKEGIETKEVQPLVVETDLVIETEENVEIPVDIEE